MKPDRLNGLWQRILEALDATNAPEIARKLRKTKQSVYEWRDGKSPGLDTLISIAETGNVSLDWLILGKEPKRRNSITEHLKSAVEREGQPIQQAALDPLLRAEIRREVVSVVVGLLLSERDRAFADALVKQMEQEINQRTPKT